jgi:hypothetical protein
MAVLPERWIDFWFQHAPAYPVVKDKNGLVVFRREHLIR